MYSGPWNIDLLDQGYEWTAARIAAVPADHLDAPTPCSLWNLRELLDHTIGSLTMLTDAVAGPDEPEPRRRSRLSDRPPGTWPSPSSPPGAVGRGKLPASWTAPSSCRSAPCRHRRGVRTLLETVVHGWDISQASGEAAAIPDELAVLSSRSPGRRSSIANRGDNFAADLGIGDTPSDRLVAYLGRKPQ